jgi:hypothetical protein
VGAVVHCGAMIAPARVGRVLTAERRLRSTCLKGQSAARRRCAAAVPFHATDQPRRHCSRSVAMRETEHSGPTRSALSHLPQCDSCHPGSAGSVGPRKPRPVPMDAARGVAQK